MVNVDSLDEFTRAYIECAIWADADNLAEQLGKNDYPEIDDISDNLLGKMIADCAKFQVENSALLKSAYVLYKLPPDGCTTAPDMAGHDFWLTRCGHGAGFWDRGLGTIGEELSEKARAFGNVDLYIGERGKIYA